MMCVLRKSSSNWFCYLILQRFPGIVAMNPFLSLVPLGFGGVEALCCVFNGDFTTLACRFGLLQGLGHGSV